MKKIVIFVSGSGSNAQRIVEFAKNESLTPFEIEAIFCNNPKAFAIQRAEKLDIPCVVFNRKEFYESSEILIALEQIKPDLIVLAGFLWLIPQAVIEAYRNKIINIHPALLPKYGGKGMFGDRVHQAVLDHAEKESGITIHYVTENYDEGDVILQKTCPVRADDTIESLATRIHALEHQWFPVVVEQLLG